MKRFLCLLSLMAIVVGFTASNSFAGYISYSASSEEAGWLGYLLYDSDVFDHDPAGEGDIWDWEEDYGWLTLYNAALADFYFKDSDYEFDYLDLDESGYLFFDVTLGGFPVLMGGGGCLAWDEADNSVIIGEVIYGAGSIGIGDNAYDDVTWTATPEPGSMVLLGFGLAGLAGLIRKAKKQ